MTHPPTSSLPPLHPSSTPLGEGSIVYKIIRLIDKRKLASYFTVHKDPSEAIRQYGNATIMKDIKRDRLVYMSTGYLGYVLTGRYDMHLDRSSTNSMIGHDVMWEKPTHKFKLFEDEQMLISLSDLVILTPDEIEAEALKKEDDN